MPPTGKEIAINSNNYLITEAKRVAARLCRSELFCKRKYGEDLCTVLLELRKCRTEEERMALMSELFLIYEIITNCHYLELCMYEMNAEGEIISTIW